MGMEELVKELYERREKAKQMGGKERVARQRARGRLTARERIERLLDPSTFWETGLLNTSDIPGMEDGTAADGRICGFGFIDKRQVAVIALDPTVAGGSGGRVGHFKVEHMLKVASDKGYPIIRLNDGVGGARVPDWMGSRGFAGDKHFGSRSEFTWFNVRQTPRIDAVMGECFGEPSWNTAASDFAVMVKGTAMGAAGPRILGKAISESTTPEQLAGWELHAYVTGQIDAFADNDEQALAIIRTFLSYMPSHNGEEPPFVPTQDDPARRLEDVGRIIPDPLNRSYDMYRFIRVLVDDKKYFPIKPEFGKAIVTCLARIGGRVVGIIANNPLFNAGAPDAHAIEKETDFIVLCDSFNIPLIFLIDVPGMYPGTDSEKQKLPTKIMVLLQAISQATVPKIPIVMRKAYGIGWRCMGAAQDDMHAAWPTASISFVEPEIGVEVVHGRRIARSEDPEAEREKYLEQWAVDSAPWGAAAVRQLEVIDPKDTRKWLWEALNVLKGNRGNMIGKHYLANWPTGF